MSNPDFLTQEELEDKFETDRSFDDEPVAQTLGRFVWLSVRSRAELLLTLHDIGVEADKIPHIIDAFGEVQTDFLDFILMGLGQTREDLTDSHPLLGAVDETTDELVEEIREQSGHYGEGTGGVIPDEIGIDAMYENAQLGDEELLQKMNRYKDSIVG